MSVVRIPWIFSQPDFVRKGVGNGLNKYVISGLCGSGKTSWINKMPRTMRKLHGDEYFPDDDISPKIFNSDMRAGLSGKDSFAAEGIQMAYLPITASLCQANVRVIRTSFLFSTYRAWRRGLRMGAKLNSIYKHIKNNFKHKKRIDQSLKDWNDLETE